MKKLLMREEKRLRPMLLEQYGIDSRDIEFYSSDGSLKGKIYFSSIPKILMEHNKKLDISSLKINNIGLYLGVITNDGLRLGMDAAQLLGRRARKNIIEIDEQQLVEWLNGKHVKLKKGQAISPGFCIVKHKDIFLGSGKVGRDTETLYNYTPKARRVKESMLNQLRV